MSNLQNLCALILAGGLGTRLRSVVSDVPKPMAIIGGKPFLEYQLELLESSGIQKVVLAVGFKSEIIKSHFGDRWRSIDIAYSDESRPLGTGGCIIKACRILREQNCPVLVMNGDTFFPITIGQMHQFSNQNSAGVTIAMMTNSEAGRYSNFEKDENGQLKISSDSSSALKSGGIYIFSKSLVCKLGQMNIETCSFENDLTPELIDDGVRFVAYVQEAEFIDIGLPEDYLRAEGVIKANR